MDAWIQPTLTFRLPGFVNQTDLTERLVVEVKQGRKLRSIQLLKSDLIWKRCGVSFFFNIVGAIKKGNMMRIGIKLWCKISQRGNFAYAV